MPRLPVDGKKVVEHRITLGTYEREQLNRFVDGLQIRNIGQGFGAATDPLEAMFNTTTGTIGGAFVIAWALKRFFGIDVPIPTDFEDIGEIWAAINDALFLTPEQRQELNERLTAETQEAKEKAGLFGVKIVSVTREIELALANLLFGNKDSITNNPDLYADNDPYANVDLGGDSQNPDFEGPPTLAQYRVNVADAWYNGQFPFSYARDLLIQSGMSEAAASEFLNQYEIEKSGSS